MPCNASRHGARQCKVSQHGAGACDAGKAIAGTCSNNRLPTVQNRKQTLGGTGFVLFPVMVTGCGPNLSGKEVARDPESGRQRQRGHGPRSIRRYRLVGQPFRPVRPVLHKRQLFHRARAGRSGARTHDDVLQRKLGRARDLP